MRRSLICLAAVALFLMAEPCLGWGRDGHRVIGAIAWQFMPWLEVRTTYDVAVAPDSAVDAVPVLAPLRLSARMLGPVHGVRLSQPAASPALR